MKRLLLLLLVLLSACAPRISDDQKARLNKILEDGATLNALTEQGVNFGDFSAQLAKTKGSYDLAAADWPSNLAPEAQEELEAAFEGWSLAQYLWNAQISKHDEPTEPNVNRYVDIVAYAGKDNLIVKTHSQTSLVKQYQGKDYLSFDNIGILLGLGSGHFDAAQTLLLAAMK